jgi:hypothetical protein
MASESVPDPDSYAGIDEYIPLCIKRRRTVRGQPQALVSWKPGWSSCTDTKDPVYATVDSIIKRARDGTLVRWKDSWELESEVCWVPDHATPIPGSSGSRDDGPSGDAGGGENPRDGGEGVKEDSGLSNVPRSTAKGRRIVTPSKRLLESLASRNQQPLPSTASSFSATPRVVTSAVHANPRVPPGPPGQSQSTASTSPPGGTGISLQSSGGLPGPTRSRPPVRPLFLRVARRRLKQSCRGVESSERDSQSQAPTATTAVVAEDSAAAAAAVATVATPMVTAAAAAAAASEGKAANGKRKRPGPPPRASFFPTNSSTKLHHRPTGRTCNKRIRPPRNAGSRRHPRW